MADLFVDTNVFLRYLTNDDPKKAQREEALFKRAVAGKVALQTSLLVIAEMVWTLESFYQLPKDDVAEKIEKILNTPNLHCEHRTKVLEALDVYVEMNVDFIDAEEPGDAGFSGSLVVVDFPSIAEAQAWADADPYIKAGVYDTVTVKPFKKVLP